MFLSACDKMSVVGIIGKIIYSKKIFSINGLN